MLYCGVLMYNGRSDVDYFVMDSIVLFKIKEPSIGQMTYCSLRRVNKCEFISGGPFIHREFSEALLFSRDTNTRLRKNVLELQ